MKNFLYTLSALLLLNACETSNTGNHAPIVLGDSSMIVTETDSQYVTSMIQDYAPIIKTEVKDTATQPVVAAVNKIEKKDTVKAADPVVTNKNTKGLHINFGNFELTVPDVKVRESTTIKGNNAAFTLTDGNLSNKTIVADKGSIQQVQQQYTTAIFYYDGRRKIALNGLSNYTSSWEKLKANNTGNLNESGLRNSNPSAAQLKAAVEKTLRQSRVSKKDINAALKKIGSKSRATSAPFSTELKVLKWKITAKGSDGKTENFQVRFDIP